MYKNYKRLMRRCIALAKKGEGRVSPNPLVGAVIFDDNFNIISQGYHEMYGHNHAERNAILNSKGDLHSKSLIVNLEPCSHYGKTPPCADLIIKTGIKKVIIGMTDPNPLVSGKGIEKLKNAGIEVIQGVLEEECKELNKIFIKNQIHNKPYITIKTAMTLDAKIASRTGNSKWITDEFSRKYVHKLRNSFDAVLTGSSTVIKDNPSMTCRIKNGRNPVRIVLDTHLTTPVSSKFYEKNAEVIVLTGETTEKAKIEKFQNYAKVIKCPEKNGHINIKEAVKILYDCGIRSILTEAGGAVNNAFISEYCADELIIFAAPKILADCEALNFVYGSVTKNISDCYNLDIVSTKLLKKDIIVKCKFNFREC